MEDSQEKMLQDVSEGADEDNESPLESQPVHLENTDKVQFSAQELQKMEQLELSESTIKRLFLYSIISQFVCILATLVVLVLAGSGVSDKKHLVGTKEENSKLVSRGWILLIVEGLLTALGAFALSTLY